MIRVYLNEYYGYPYIDMAKKRERLDNWLANINRFRWEWGITILTQLPEINSAPRCIYFKDKEDATAFCLTFGITSIVCESKDVW
jgi:hypothetical protein